jgi:predicted PurR-regulated permease PerM
MEFKDQKINIEISTNSIIKVLIFLILLGVLYLIRNVVAIVFFAIILVSILEPIVSWLISKKIPKILAVLMIYLLLVGILAGILVLIIPPISTEINQLSSSFPYYWQRATTEFSNLNDFLSQYGISQGIETSLKSWQFQLPESTGTIVNRVSDFISGIFSLFVVLVITFHILVEEGATRRILRSLLPSKYLPYAYQLVSKIQKKLGYWLRGQMILCFIIFLLVYAGLLWLGVKYALVFAIIAGLLEFIPYLGPFVSGTIAVSLTFFQSPVLAVLVLILYIFIQIVENNFLVPKVMQKAVGLNPVISILSLLIGGKLGGLIGVILAIPIATALSVVVQDFFDQRKADDLKLEE